MTNDLFIKRTIMNAIKLLNCEVLSKNDFAFLTKLLNRKDKTEERREDAIAK